MRRSRYDKDPVMTDRFIIYRFGGDSFPAGPVPRHRARIVCSDDGSWPTTAGPAEISQPTSLTPDIRSYGANAKSS